MELSVMQSRAEPHPSCKEAERSFVERRALGSCPGPGLSQAVSGTEISAMWLQDGSPQLST